MDRDVTFAKIVQRGLQLGDMETSELVTPDEARDIGNESYARWYWMVARAEPERFERRYTFTADGSTQYGLPADFAVEMAVEYVPSDNSTPLPLEFTEFENRNLYGTVATGGAAAGFRVAETGSGRVPQLWLLPPPNSGDYRVLYLPVPPVLSDTDKVNGNFGWERWISLDIGITCLNKEESDASGQLLERAEIQKEIELAARKRSLKRARKIVDVRRTRTRYGVPGVRDPDWYVS